MMLVVRRDLVELILECSHPGDAVDKLQVPLGLVVPPGVIDDSIADRLIDSARELERHLGVIQAAGPGILIVNPEHLTRLAEHSTNAVEQYGFAVGEVVEDISN